MKTKAGINAIHSLGSSDWSRPAAPPAGGNDASARALPPTECFTRARHGATQFQRYAHMVTRWMVRRARAPRKA